MKCPHCDVPMFKAARKGIDIDYCAQCRGVWLDRGELDKLIDLSVDERFQVRATTNQGNRSSTPTPYVVKGKDSTVVDDFNTPRGAMYRKPSKRRKFHAKSSGKHKSHKGFLGELFDFFD